MAASIEPIVVEIVDAAVERPPSTRLFTTLEGENPSGSIKDRLVLGELTELLAARVLRPGDVVSEISAGSTARSLAHYCHELGLGCVLFVPTSVPEAAVAAMRSLGASVHQVPYEGAYEAYGRYCAEHASHPFDQLFDLAKSRHYRSLGAAVAAHAGPVGAVVGAVGTGHSLLGSADGIDPRPYVVSAEPDRPGVIAGVRNVERERYGPADACSPELFDRRIVIATDDLPPGSFATDRGDVEVGASFRLVLAALSRLLADRDWEQVFLVGAENRRPAQPA